MPTRATHSPSRRFAIANSLLTLGATHASGVIVYDTTATRQLSAPTDSRLAAWNLQGRIRNFNMTPIAPNAFIMARHINGGSEAPGEIVTFGTQSFALVAKTDIAGTDLRIWTVNGTFSSYASLWNPAVDGSEDGKPLVVFGRGRAPGAAFTAPLVSGPVAGPMPTSIGLTGSTASSNLSPAPTLPGDLRGWRWGVDDRQASWGANVVDGTITDSSYGGLLTFDFDADPTERVDGEAILAEGDSSGGVFVLSNGVWKLAGVNLGVDNSWSLSESGAYVQAAIFDARGLWIGTSASHDLVSSPGTALAASSYASSIGANYAAILAAIGGSGSAGGEMLVPEPTMVTPVVLLALTRRRR